MTSSVSARMKSPLFSLNISLVIKNIHSLNNPPASYTLSPFILIFTSLCRLQLSILTKDESNTLSLSISSQSAPCYQGILILSN